MSVKDAMLKYLDRQIVKPSDKPKKKNQKPEKVTEKSVTDWLKIKKYPYNVVESKAVWNTYAGRYVNGQVDSGYSDVSFVICDEPFNGIAGFIELKALGRRSTASEKQLDFLRERIVAGAFGCVTDRLEHLLGIYEKWYYLRLTNLEGSRQYLLSELPQKKSDNKPLFEE
jgi:hypothetical protein